MRQIITFLFIFLSINLIAQDKFVAHDYINGNIPSYKPTFQESFPKWAKLLYENEANFYDIQQSYKLWKLDNSKKEFKAVERYYKIWTRMKTLICKIFRQLQIIKVKKLLISI